MKAKLHKGKPVRENDILVVLGDGRSMPDDRDRFNDWDIPGDFACIGRSIKTCPYALHWFNADGETAIAWARQLKENNPGLITHSLGTIDGFDCDWDVEQPDYRFEDITHQHGRLHGSSAMFATLAGLAMGYQKIILAGCPMDQEGHWYFDPKGPDTLGPMWIGVDFMAWIDFAREPEAFIVRSMSGYTAKLLGKPDRGWLIEL